MAEALNLTNGDVAAQRMREGEVPGPVVPWRDVLHEGPVPAGLSLDELSDLRARFLGGCGWAGSYRAALERFQERDDALKGFRRHAEVVLWFEHDLCDQLQLLQVLHWFGLRERGATRLSLICIDAFPGVEPFHGLGQLDARQIAGLRETRHEVTDPELRLAGRAWEAFGAAEPTAMVELLREDLSPLPFLRAAFRRHLEQFPSTRDGLSRTERQILEVLARGPRELGALFRESQTPERVPFLGDTAFLGHAASLADGRQPLVELEAGGGAILPERGEAPDEASWRRAVRITESGRKVLTGQSDRTRFQRIDRWLGGVHLTGDQPAWRWDASTRELCRR